MALTPRDIEAELMALEPSARSIPEPLPSAQSVAPGPQFEPGFDAGLQIPPGPEPEYPDFDLMSMMGEPDEIDDFDDADPLDSMDSTRIWPNTCRNRRWIGWPIASVAG
jgi:hypothetical protein